ncbi:MAG TPA: amidohydrolase [Cryptosporangiaceae bacterium]|nr:amidohydrolase [Cryptosporangiaceae bacterium]
MNTATATASDPHGTAAIAAHLDRWLAAHGDELVRLRRHLHAHPEVSGAEYRTAALLADHLSAVGLEPELLPKGNGVLCDVGPPAGAQDTIVALRADIDALPLADAKNVPYRSTVVGVCHACGHDVHAAIVTGVGMALAEVQNELPGRIRLILQPAEEVLPCGSLEVIEAGGIKGVSQIYALHCDPRLFAGQVGLRTGPITAAADNLIVRLTGPGGHTARPHLTVDLVEALGRLVTEVPALLNRRVDIRSGMLMVFGAVGAGKASNAIPTEAFAEGSVRMLDRRVWDDAPELVTRLIHQVIAPTGAVAEVNYQRGRPPVVNDPVAIAHFAAGATAALGPASVMDTPQSMGGEDYSWYLEHVPGAMARLGVGRPDEHLDLHQNIFDVDERAIEVGVRLLAHTALHALAG